jgi:DNA-binding LacI/PurR family transcriptional regulator
VDQNSQTIGERAARLALALIESKTPMKPKTILVEPKLVVRQSTMLLR